MPSDTSSSQPHASAAAIAAAARAYLFDMDGVLVANSDAHVDAWIEFMRREYGLVPSAEFIRRCLGLTNHGYLKALLGREPSPEEVRRAVAEKERLYRELFGPKMAAPEGLVELLRLAGARGVPCAVASSAPVENIDFVLDGLSIRPFFQGIVHAEMVRRGKPAPDVYLRAAEALGIAPADCVVFEDALAGIQSGRAAGARVLGITSSYPASTLLAAEFPPDATFDRFAELLPHSRTP